MKHPETGLQRPKLILFDVYDTLLNMSDIEKKVNLILDSRNGYTIWFELFMQYCFVDNCTSQFHDFNAIANATMQMAAYSMGENVKQEKINSVLEMLKHLPLYEGVQEGLSAIHDQNLRIAALTNSPENTVRERMERTGLISYFEKVFSAEQVRKYKPDVAVYNWAAHELKLQPNEILLVTSHGWDVAGAANAGMKTAYRQQSRQLLYSLSHTPDLIFTDLTDLAGKISS